MYLASGALAPIVPSSSYLERCRAPSRTIDPNRPLLVLSLDMVIEYVPLSSSSVPSELTSRPRAPAAVQRDTPDTSWPLWRGCHTPSIPLHFACERERLSWAYPIELEQADASRAAQDWLLGRSVGWCLAFYTSLPLDIAHQRLAQLRMPLGVAEADERDDGVVGLFTKASGACSSAQMSLRRG